MFNKSMFSDMPVSLDMVTVSAGAAGSVSSDRGASGGASQAELTSPTGGFSQTGLQMVPGNVPTQQPTSSDACATITQYLMRYHTVSSSFFKI